MAPPVPPTPRRRELRDLPTPDEIVLTDPLDIFGGLKGLDVRPMPGGCLVSMGPRSRGRRGRR